MKHSHLAHIKTEGYYQFITFRTADSTNSVVLRLAAQSKPNREKQMAIDEYLDTSQQGAYLHGNVLRFLFDFIRENDGELYELACFAIMPNHVHVLIKPLRKLAVVMQRVKGASAKGINDIMGKRGTFWEKDYYDKAIRDEDHFRVVYQYIENNPLKLSMNGAPEDALPNTNDILTYPGGEASASQKRDSQRSASPQMEKPSAPEDALPNTADILTHPGGEASASLKRGSQHSVSPQMEKPGAPEDALPDTADILTYPGGEASASLKRDSQRSVSPQMEKPGAPEGALPNTNDILTYPGGEASASQKVAPPETLRFYGVYDA